MDDVCCICFDAPTNTKLIPCNHQFCKYCIQKSIEKKVTCPLCRTLVLDIPDLRDNLVEYKTITFQENTFAGITLSNMNLKNAVKVKSLHSKDRAKMCGVRRGDVIKSLNGIPCKDHTEAIALINGCTNSKLNIQCEIIETTAGCHCL